MTRTLILVLFIVLLTAALRWPDSDDVSGTWKRTSMVLVDATGKTTDMMEMMSRTMPCTKDITYTFLSNGQMKTNVPDACGTIKKTIESMNASGRWVQNGRKLIVTTTLKNIPPANYDLNVQSNIMTWVFNYADNPEMTNPTKAKKMTIVYQRV